MFGEAIERSPHSPNLGGLAVPPLASFRNRVGLCKQILQLAASHVDVEACRMDPHPVPVFDRIEGPLWRRISGLMFLY
jgi:hypothetical protein